MKIAFIHTDDIYDKNLWSGTVYYIYQTLAKKFDEIVFYRPTGDNYFALKFLFGGIERLTRKLTGKHGFNLYYSYFYPKALSSKVDNFVKNTPVDFIVSTTNTPFIFTENKVPLIIITDATVKLLFDEYSDGKGWSKLFYKDLERSALKIAQKATLIVASSESTTNSLINDYKIVASKIATIPFGANIEDEDIPVVKRIADQSKPLNILFVGRDWERKGGDFAVSICDELIKQKVNIHLDIVGCSVPEKFQRDYLTNYVFLDKNKIDDFITLKKLYSEAHFFMVFSKAEMYGVVFCEAAAYGLPVITFAVGGINDIVVNEKTGIMLPKGTGTEFFVSKIKALISDPECYRNMSGEARNRYETLLNWDTFMNSLKSKMHEILNSNLHPTMSNSITT